MAPKPSISIVGLGRLGRALAENVVGAGYRIDEIIFSNVQSLRKNRRHLSRELQIRANTLEKALLNADVVWLSVPDSQIESVAQRLKSVTSWKGKVVVHSSGALTSDALQPLRKQGAGVASAHPLMTFVHGARPAIKGIPFALEGDPAALRTIRPIVKKLGAQAFVVRKQNKAQYHAWATLLSPLLLSFLVAAEQVAKVAGISPMDARGKMLPIAQQTLLNYVTLGPAGAFSGPLVRGDIAVVKDHLKVLKKIPEAREIYIASARSALQRLPAHNRKQLEKLLRTK